LVEALSGTVAVVVLVVALPVAVAVVALPELDVERVEYRVAVRATMVYS